MFFSPAIILATVIVMIPFCFQQWANKKTHTPQTLASLNPASSVLFIFICGLALFSLEVVKNPQESQRILGIAFFSAVYLFWVRGKKVNLSRGIEISPKDQFVMSARAFVGMGLLYGTYFLVLKFVGHTLTPLIGVPFGLLAVYASTPLILRAMWKTSVIVDPEIRSTIENSFQSAGVKINRLYFIEMKQVKFHNALVCGPKWGFGPFQQSLFITQSLFENLSKDEVQAVLLHEASHFKLKHMPKRMAAAFLAFLISASMIVAISYINFLVFQHTVSAIIGLALFLLIQTPFVAFVSRRHEFEADLEAVRLGAKPDALASALRRISELSGVDSNYKADFISKTVMGMVHPSIPERISVLTRGFIPRHEYRYPLTRYAFLFTAILCSQLSMSYFFAPTATASRTVASEKLDH